MHHIHAKTCITRCRVLVSGMYDSGFRRLSITKLYRLIILSLRPFVMSDNNRSTLKKGKSNTKVKFIKIRYIAPIPSISYRHWDYLSVIQGLQQADLRNISHRGKERGRADIHRLTTFTQRSYISRRIWRKYFIPSLTHSAKIIEIIRVPIICLRLPDWKVAAV